MTEHLDLDALADVLSGAAPEAAEHLMECPECRAGLDELRAASARTTASLASLPTAPVPQDVADRLSEALAGAGAGSPAAAGGATVTTLPPTSRRGTTTSGPGRWLGAAAAVAVLLAGAGYGVSRLGGNNGQATSATGSAAKAAGPAGLRLVRNSTGNDYTSREALAAAVPGLLNGTTAADRAAASAPAVQGGANNAAGARPQAQAGADPLARLRTASGLADCLIALLPPDDPTVRPLALDYAQYKGQPALVVVLPGSISGKLDVFVVGPGCSQANDSTLFYTSVDKP